MVKPKGWFTNFIGLLKSMKCFPWGHKYLPWFSHRSKWEGHLRSDAAQNMKKHLSIIIDAHDPCWSYHSKNTSRIGMKGMKPSTPGVVGSCMWLDKYAGACHWEISSIPPATRDTSGKLAVCALPRSHGCLERTHTNIVNMKGTFLFVAVVFLLSGEKYVPFETPCLHTESNLERFRADKIPVPIN